MPFYLEALWKSADIRWLRERRKDGVRGSKYFFGLLLIVSLAYSVTATYGITKDLKIITQKAAIAAPDLSFAKKEGKIVASGIAQPFTFESDLEGQKLFVFINTATSSAAVPAKTFSESKKDTMVVVITEDKVDILNTADGTTYVLNASELPDNASIPYGKTARTVEEFVKTPRFFAMVVTTLAVIIFILFTIAELLYIAFIAGIVAIVARVKKAPWTFGDIFTVSMFAITLPLLVGDVLPLLGVEVSYIGTIIFMGLLFAIVFYKGEEPLDSKEEKSGE